MAACTKTMEPAIEIGGAGPAGLSAALAARKAGNRVLVPEKNSDVGRRFKGDFQGLENWTGEYDVLAGLERMGIRTHFIHTPVYEFVCFDSAGTAHCLRASDPIFYLVKRGSEEGTLDHALKTQALETGVEIRFNSRLSQFSGPDLIVAEGPHRANVIAAGYVFETDMANGCFAVISESLAPAGYGYLLVSQGHGTVATCMFDKFHDEHACLERTLEFFRRHAGLRWHFAERNQCF